MEESIDPDKETASPTDAVLRSIQEHPILWASAGAVAGWVLAKLLFPEKPRVVYVNTPTTVSRGGSILSTLITLSQHPAVSAFVQKKVTELLDKRPNQS